MQSLVNYVQSIHEGSDTPRITLRASRHDSWSDQGFEVSREVTDYHFDDGVVIRRTTEQDQFPTELACAECWIEYEVIERAGLDIQPARKHFDNRCREAWWLRYHSA
jgi:hypothetical protein